MTDADNIEAELDRLIVPAEKVNILVEALEKVLSNIKRMIEQHNFDTEGGLLGEQFQYGEDMIAKWRGE